MAEDDDAAALDGCIITYKKKFLLADNT
jgi:hypothetical protein